MQQQLISDTFKFREFIDFIKDKDWRGMHDAVQHECSAVEQLSSRCRGAPAARAAGSLQYIRQLKQFAYFLGRCVCPAGVSPSDFQLYREPAMHLAQLGQLLGEPQKVLALFEEGQKEFNKVAKGQLHGNLKSLATGVESSNLPT